MRLKMALPTRVCGGVRALVRHSIHSQGIGRSEIIPYLTCRCLNSTPGPHLDHDHVSPPGRLKKYVVDRFMRYVDRYETILGKRYPKAYKVYKVFTVGMRDFLSDAHSYYSTSTALWAGDSLSSFSRSELETYRQAPRDLVKMAPMLLVTALPLVPYALFPIAYLFPRHFLTSHFWTNEQKTDFARLAHRKRIQHFPAILDYLHNQSRYVESSGDRELLNSQLKKLESYQSLSVNDILRLRRFFESFPYQLERLSMAHLRHLGRSLGMSLRRFRLMDEAILLQHIDKAMVREGIEKMTDSELEKACFWRGLNPVGLRREERIAYLTQWTQVTSSIGEEAISLLLHSPVLLAYSQPTNRIFMSQKLRWRPRKSK